MASKGEWESDGHQDLERVREQLARILASPEFQAPERGRRFLQYVVEETVEGRCKQLKAHSIAQAVFGRDATFDAQNDPIVRIEVGRIRRSLERYYLVSGSNDPVRITIPKGGYIPSFEHRRETSDATKGDSATGSSNRKDLSSFKYGQQRPMTYRDLILPIGVPAVFAMIAVLALIRPLEAYLTPSATSPASVPSISKNEVKIIVEPLVALDSTKNGADIAKGIADQLIAQLSKAGNTVLVSPSPSAERPVGRLFNLQGSITVGETSLHVHVRLLKSADGTVVWVKEYDRELRGGTTLDVEDEIAAQIAGEISKNGEINGLQTGL